MKKKSSERAKLKTKKIRFNLYTPGIDLISLAGDFNACVLVIPEVSGMHKEITPSPGGPPEYHLGALCVGRKEAKFILY